MHELEGCYRSDNLVHTHNTACNNVLMALAPRPRKRVCAFRRAPDGSAFQKCGTCGVSVVVALADLHHCETKMDAKRFKGIDGNRCVPQTSQGFKNQTASPFRLFMESFKKGYEMENEIVIERLGFEKWKSMSVQEKHPFMFRARVLDRAHQAALDKEANELAKMKVNDEADSAMVNKVDKDLQSKVIDLSSDDSA